MKYLKHMEAKNPGHSRRAGTSCVSSFTLLLFCCVTYIHWIFLISVIISIGVPERVCVSVDVSLTQQQDFDLLFLLLLLLLELLFDGPVHSDGPLLLLRQTAHAGAAAPLPTASHGQKPLEK